LGSREISLPKQLPSLASAGGCAGARAETEEFEEGTLEETEWKDLRIEASKS
jgi:hypothetical protein